MSEQMREALETVTDALFNFYAMVENESPSLLVDYHDAEDAWRAIEVGKAALAASPAEKLEPVAWLEHSLEGDVIGVTLHPDGTWPTTPLYAAPVDAHNYSIGLKFGF